MICREMGRCPDEAGGGLRVWPGEGVRDGSRVLLLLSSVGNQTGETTGGDNDKH